MADTYTINCWECEGGNPETEEYEDEGWKAAFTGIQKWQLRQKLRVLYSLGWTPISLQVIAETHDRPAGRWDRGYFSKSHVDDKTFRWIRKYMPREEEPKRQQRLFVEGVA